MQNNKKTMPTKQNHRTISKSKVRSNSKATITINTQKGKSKKIIRKKTKKSMTKAKLHNNASHNRNKSKPQTLSSTKDGKIKPKKNEREIREDTVTYWDVLYANTRKMYKAYYSLMNYYANPFFNRFTKNLFFL